LDHAEEEEIKIETVDSSNDRQEVIIQVLLHIPLPFQPYHLKEWLEATLIVNGLNYWQRRSKEYTVKKIIPIRRIPLAKLEESAKPFWTILVMQ
jgi:hypothetical protein